MLHPDIYWWATGGLLRGNYVLHFNTVIVSGLLTLVQIRPNKKIPGFLDLNLLVKPRFFFRLSGKKYNLMHFERRNVYNYIFFQKIKMCAYPT